MHSLVLLGNFQTASLMQKLGHSTKGWSNVGLHLSESLSSELDVIMGTVSTDLTSAIDLIMKIKANIDTSLYSIGNKTDSTLLQVEHRTASIGFQKLALAASAKEGWRGPKASQATLLELSALTNEEHHSKPSVKPELQGESENEIMWMMETSRSLKLGKSSHSGMDSAALAKIQNAALHTLKSSEVASDVNVQRPHLTAGTPLSQKPKSLIQTAEDRKADHAVLQWFIENKDHASAFLIQYSKEHVAEANALWRAARAEATSWALSTIDKDISSTMDVVNEQLDAFLTSIKPSLLQIGKWLQSFGTKVQAVLEGFSTTLDKVQKMIDKLMAKLATSKPGSDKAMLHDTFTLFDASNTGSVTAEDLSDVGEVYGITALVGDKGKTLVDKYDADKSKSLSKEEFKLFVKEPTIPGAMGVVLRAYSKNLARISGNVAAARKRDEVAAAVVQYLELVCAKNITKVGWISQALTNGSLVKDFSADVLKNMAMAGDNPARMISVDPGPIIIHEMITLDADYVAEVVQLLSSPEFWQKEGFDMKEQPKVIERVTKWMMHSRIPKDFGEHASLVEEPVGKLLHQLHGGGKAEVHKDLSLLSVKMGVEAHDAMPRMAHKMVSERSRVYLAKQHAYRAQVRAKLFSTRSSRTLFQEIFGGGTMGSTTDDPEAMQAVQSGVDARPETLLFAQYLAANSSDTAKRFQNQTMDYMGDSSSALDAFATQIQAMIKKTQNFLNMMMQYSTPTGIEKLENLVKEFIGSAESQVKSVIHENIITQDSNLDQSQVQQTAPEIAAADVAPVFQAINTLLGQLQAILPEVVADLKFAKKEVSAVSKQLHTIFNQLDGAGPPVFFQISELYGMAWTAYFTLFVVLTLSLLVYGFWATGWFGGVEIPADSEYQPPTTIGGRISVVCSACCGCIKSAHDNCMCFWSCIITFEIFVLLMFIIAIVLTLVSGIKAFMGAGCSSIYFLGDNTLCQGIMGMVKGWLETFWGGAASSLGGACQSESLLTCSLIQEKLGQAMMFTTLGSLLAAVLTFQLIVNTAQLHEQARWVRYIHNHPDKKGQAS
jgi:hypothetical protein